MKLYIRPITICIVCILLCFSVFFGIKFYFFGSLGVLEPIDQINKSKLDNNFVEAVTKEATEEVQRTTINQSLIPKTDWINDDNSETIYENTNFSIEHPPYEIAPTFVDDGSIIYEGKTLTEITNQINEFYKNSYLRNTGYFFANFTKRTGINPYMLVAITAAEQGCNSTCNQAAINNNNFFGMLYYSGGTLYHCRYATLEEGLNAFFNNVSYLYGTYSDPSYSVQELTDRWNPSGGENYRNTIYRFMDQVKSK